MVLFHRLTRQHVWNRNIAGQWMSNTSSSLLVFLGPVTMKGLTPTAACWAWCLQHPLDKS